MGKKNNYVKTTKEDYDFFKSEVYKWADKLGLQGWEIIIERKDHNKSRGHVHINREGRIAVLRLAKNYSKGCYSKEDIADTALHEALEVVFTDIRDMIYKDGETIDDCDVDAEIHKIIHIMSKLLLSKG